jgi:hypothetical protein
MGDLIDLDDLSEDEDSNVLNSEIDKANKEIKEKINKTAFLRITPVSGEEEAKAIFENQQKAASAFIDFIFNMNDRTYRSRLCVVSYDMGFPILIKSLIDTGEENIAESIRITDSKADLHKNLKLILNSKHMKRLYIMAKKESIE